MTADEINAEVYVARFNVMTESSADIDSPGDVVRHLFPPAYDVFLMAEDVSDEFVHALIAGEYYENAWCNEVGGVFPFQAHAGNWFLSICGHSFHSMNGKLIVTWDARDSEQDWFPMEGMQAEFGTELYEAIEFYYGVYIQAKQWHAYAVYNWKHSGSWGPPVTKNGSKLYDPLNAYQNGVAGCHALLDWEIEHRRKALVAAEERMTLLTGGLYDCQNAS